MSSIEHLDAPISKHPIRGAGTETIDNEGSAISLRLRLRPLAAQFSPATRFGPNDLAPAVSGALHDNNTLWKRPRCANTMTSQVPNPGSAFR